MKELKLNERENEIFQKETLLKAKIIEINQNDFELNNITNRIDKYKVENHHLTNKTQKIFEEIESFYLILKIRKMFFIRLKESNINEINEQINEERKIKIEQNKIREDLSKDLEVMLEVSKELEKIHSDVYNINEPLKKYS